MGYTKKAKIKLTLGVGRSVVVPAFVRKGLAVHRMVTKDGSPGKGWTVSHVPTGCAIRTWDLLEDARLCLRLLLQTWDRWETLRTEKAANSSDDAKVAFRIARQIHPRWWAGR